MVLNNVILSTPNVCIVLVIINIGTEYMRLGYLHFIRLYVSKQFYNRSQNGLFLENNMNFNQYSLTVFEDEMLIRQTDKQDLRIFHLF